MDKIFYIVFSFFICYFNNLNAQNMSLNKFLAYDSLVDLGIQKKAFPGAQLLIFSKDSIRFHKSYGFHTYDSIIKVKNTDLYDLASVTKVLAGTLAFMKLYELYSINLNEKVANYLPAFKRSNKKNSSFKEVLSHSSGWLPYIAHQNLLRKKNSEFKRRTLKLKQSKRYPNQISDSLFLFKNYPNKIIRRIRKTKISEVGRYKYSGLWFFLIPKITKQLSGLSFENFLKMHFYEKLKLDRLTFLPSKKYPKMQIVPTEYDSQFRKQQIQGWVHDEAAALMGGISGNAGLFANAASIAPILEMLLKKGVYKGRVYLKSETIKLFTSRAYPNGNNRRGLGFDKPSLNEDHDRYPSNFVSESSFGHTGFTGTLIWVDPEKDSFLIFLSNRVYPSRSQLGIYKMKIREQILDNVFQN